MILGVVGATGSVGEEVLRLLQERRVAIDTLRAFATEDSIGVEVDYFEASVPVEEADFDAIAGCDAVIHAAPADRARVDALAERGVRVADLSGVWELESEVPLVAGAIGAERVDAAVRVAVARGAAAALSLALTPLHAAAALGRVTVTVLEGASGVGRRGVDTLSEETVQVLNAMDGGTEGGSVFPGALAFDCLPLVGTRGAGGGSDEEQRLGDVTRRLLDAPTLPIECTRVRVPVFLGSLCLVHVETPLDLASARDGLAKAPWLELLGDEGLPSPRRRVGQDRIALGRLRATDAGLAFALAQDDLRRGSALTAVECVEKWTS